MISWWPGNGNANDIQDGNNGTLQNGATFATTGMVDQAFRLDGIDDHVLIGNPTNLQVQNFTIDAWIKLDTLSYTGDPAILEYGNGGYGFAIIRVNHAKSRELFLTKTDVDFVSAGLVISDTNWHHVAVTKNGGTVTFYLDGVGATVPGSYDPGFSFTTNISIGIRQDTLQNAFPGLIDEVEFYNRALSAAEIAPSLRPTAQASVRTQTAMVWQIMMITVRMFLTLTRQTAITMVLEIFAMRMRIMMGYQT
jgi:hypothetical protein